MKLVVSVCYHTELVENFREHFPTTSEKFCCDFYIIQCDSNVLWYWVLTQRGAEKWSKLHIFSAIFWNFLENYKHMQKCLNSLLLIPTAIILNSFRSTYKKSSENHTMKYTSSFHFRTSFHFQAKKFSVPNCQIYAKSIKVRGAAQSNGKVIFHTNHLQCRVFPPFLWKKRKELLSCLSSKPMANFQSNSPKVPKIFFSLSKQMHFILLLLLVHRYEENAHSILAW